MAKKDDRSRKLHPRLRTLGNGSQAVNAGRSGGSVTVACETPPSLSETSTARFIEAAAQQSVAGLETALGDALKVTSAARRAKRTRRRKLSELPAASDSYVNVFIEFYPERLGVSPGEQRSHIESLVGALARQALEADRGKIDAGVLPRRNIVCATVAIADLEKLTDDPAVAFVHPADPLKLDVPAPKAATNAAKSKAIKGLKGSTDGEGVIIGIIDVGGFDFSHPDFLNADGATRFLTIWDQGGNFRRPPDGFTYGSELSRERLNAALVSAKQPGIPSAIHIERQSSMEPGSHGTHVASIAAGNSGVCPKADIAAVLIDVPLPSDTLERRRWTFSDASRIVHAVEYLLKIAERECKPISINISLGTNGGAHDGSSGVSRWLDAYLATPGRAICVAAGNGGQEGAEDANDFGWIMGRIHTSGRIPARGLELEFEWNVVGNGIEDVSENELEIWYGPQDRFSVAIKPPTSGKWSTVSPGEYVQNRQLEGGTFLSVYNELYHPTNGLNYIALYLSPRQGATIADFAGIQSGGWRVRLIGDEIRDGRFNAWIERDDPVEVARDARRRLFRFPSFFSEKSNVDSHSINSIACGHRVIAVANLDDIRERIHKTSSQGPTRDDRCKPEIAAPGTDIIAANGFAWQKQRWISMTGTSMASPYVTGVVGLMLLAHPEITAAQCAGILQRTARPLAGGSYNWINDAGWGRLDAKAAIEEARAINLRTATT